MLYRYVEGSLLGLLIFELHSFRRGMRAYDICFRDYDPLYSGDDIWDNSNVHLTPWKGSFHIFYAFLFFNI